MEGQKIVDFSFKKRNQAATLGAKNNVKIGEDNLCIDSQLLFQRLLTVSDSVLENTEAIFKYELCGNPSSLFDSSGLLRVAQKPALANAIWELGQCGADSLLKEEVQYVLDGGSLVHRIPPLLQILLHLVVVLVLLHL